MTPVPLSVIGGYLGAGKTTLINALLGLDHGLRLAVLVNDFGAINIDAALLKSASEDTIELTNGCVCCTMSGDLFFAIGDLLDRNPRPDHILIEASGIADPAKIAAVSLAEKDLRYSGIVTVADGANVAAQLADPRIGAQVKGQLCAADLIVVSKREPAEVASALQNEGLNAWASATDLATITATLFVNAQLPDSPTSVNSAHPAYVQWSDTSPAPMSKDALEKRLSSCPNGLLRVKALLPDTSEGIWEVHVVGAEHDMRKRQSSDRLGVIAIGLADGLSATDLQAWWHGSDGDDPPSGTAN